MTDDAFVSAHIRFLRAHGRVTHIVSPTDVKMSAMSLVQRCLSSNVRYAVPLPDGTAAIDAPDGPPASLRLFNLEAREIDDADYANADAEPAAPDDPVATQGLGTPEPVSEPETDPFPPGPDAEAAMPEDPVTEEDIDPSEPETEPVAEAHSPESLDSTAPKGAEAPDPAQALAPLLTAIQERLTSIETQLADHAGAPDAALARLETAGKTAWGSLQARLEALPAQIAGNEDLAARFASLENSVTTLADRPAPRPDMAAFNTALARFNTAAASVLRRLEAVTDRAEDGGGAFGPAVEEALQSIAARLDAIPVPDAAAQPPGTGFATGVEAALAAVTQALAARSGADSEDNNGALHETLREISEFQQVAVRQLATLIDRDVPSARGAEEEFLADLRHAIAELIAEQQRAAAG